MIYIAGGRWKLLRFKWAFLIQFQVSPPHNSCELFCVYTFALWRFQWIYGSYKTYQLNCWALLCNTFATGWRMGVKGGVSLDTLLHWRRVMDWKNCFPLITSRSCFYDVYFPLQCRLSIANRAIDSETRQIETKVLLIFHFTIILARIQTKEILKQHVEEWKIFRFFLRSSA